ncbi:hypothetical protein AAFF_G00234870 [Aldrovandia affinis]|uniref:Periphilin-1 C-terminal domain-containing protein n=1 Tax=Aldrovandia affinis TaxID=143900 RepID=A0AAD7WV02_9TELE|nr:hypothetical protein AAFF_G00234870 [Aldrovandia affinis]
MARSSQIDPNKMGQSQDREYSDDSKDKRQNKSGDDTTKREKKVEKRPSRKSKTLLQTVAFVPKFRGRFFSSSGLRVTLHRRGYRERSLPPLQAGQSDMKTECNFSTRTLSDKNDAQRIPNSKSEEKDVGWHSATEWSGEHGTTLPAVLPSTERNRAILEKRREIEERYKQDCETFGVVATMLISKAPTLEQPIAEAMRKSLQEMGQNCVIALQRFIDEYED